MCGRNLYVYPTKRRFFPTIILWQMFKLGKGRFCLAKKRWTQWSCFSCFMLFQTQKLCVDLPGTQNVYPLYPSCWSIPPPVAPDIGSRRARPESVIIWTDRQQALRELFDTFWVWKPALFVRVASQSCLEPLSELVDINIHQHSNWDPKAKTCDENLLPPIWSNKQRSLY